VDKSVWEEAVREDADEEVMRPCGRCEGRVHTEKGKGVPIVKRGERRSERIRERTVKERVYLAV